MTRIELFNVVEAARKVRNPSRALQLAISTASHVSPDNESIYHLLAQRIEEAK